MKDKPSIAIYSQIMPEEIIGDIAVYAMTAGEMPAAGDSVLNETLADIVFTAYIDAMRDILRSEFQEEYIVSGSMARESMVCLWKKYK